MMDLPKLDLTGRTAIVTGGGMGIGKAIGLVLARAGANIAIADLDADAAQQTAKEVQALGRKSLAIPTDVCSRGQVEAMVRQTVKTFGTIDILVNNAGGMRTEHVQPALEMSEAAWDAVVALNLKSVFLCSQSVARVMIERKKGSIVNVASIAGMMAYPAAIHYGAAKAGVIGLTQSLAAILAPNNIRVNAVAPGFITTELADRMVYGPHPEMRELRQKAVPLRRLGTPEDVAWVVAYLASDASSYIAGQAIRVDGALPSVAGLTG